MKSEMAEAITHFLLVEAYTALIHNEAEGAWF